eukprot:TRINITY_DN11808_c0_g1_i1.p2 TRINITY_DN11808_c0_g1~~TRINITY_DN11808_c0_g1_i1.p2  ORF type:complete len:159 (+),score=35.90 TRINITY_DN11808_c0_g1_i1:611-1087(+)
MAETHVFVYGTLKRGFPNHDFLARAEGARLVCDSAQTREPIALVVGGPRHVPYLIARSAPGSLDGASRVAGEVYAVDPAALALLDKLEGVSSGRYARVPMELLDSAEIPTAFAYVWTREGSAEPFEGWAQQPRLAEYTQEHASEYVLPADRPPVPEGK